MHLKLITIFIFFASSISINPGLTIKLDLKNIDIVKAKFIPIINKTIEDMTIVENMRIGGFNIKQTNVKIYPIKPEQIIVGMGQGDILFLSIKNLYVKTVSNTALDMLLFDWDGKISTSGYINRVRCIVKFKKFNEKDPRPYLESAIDKVEITNFSWDIDVDADFVPSFITNKVLKVFNQLTLQLLIENIMKNIDADITSIINQAIKREYPLFFDLGYDVAVSSKLVEKVRIIDNTLLLKIDGTFYDKKKGLIRHDQPLPMDLNYVGDYLIDLFISDFSLNSIFQAIADKNMKIYKDNIDLIIYTGDQHKYISIEEGQLKFDKLKAQANIDYSGYKVKADFTLKGNLDMDTSQIDNELLKLKVKSFEFEEFNLDGNVPYITYVPGVIKFLVKTALYYNNEFTLPIPQFQLPFGIKLTKKQAILKNNNANLSVNFEIDEKRKWF